MLTRAKDARTVASGLRMAGWIVLAVGFLAIVSIYLDLTDVANNPAPAMFIVEAGVPLLGVTGLLVGLGHVVDLLADLRDRD